MAGLGIILFLFLLGYFVGSHKEKRHFASLIEREQQTVNLPVTNGKYPILPLTDETHSELVLGSVVISVDYFKRLLAGLRSIFCGNIQAYKTLVDRARHEAILRMKEACPRASEIINIRIVTSSISQGGQNQVGSVEVLASGTAVYHQ